MTKQDTQKLAHSLRNASAEALLAAVVSRFGDKVALASSLSAEDQVVTDILARLSPSPRIFTLDTGRLHQETYDVLQATNERYGIRIEVLFPDRDEVERLETELGPNCFYQSIALRKQCCHVRKVLPLRRTLATLDAWITGLRREQSLTRTEVERVEWDVANGLVKVNPLADWSAEKVWEYIRQHNVPYNRLHDQGFPSIGCAPCTRAVRRTESSRDGRWWWESPEHKECGLHRNGTAAPSR
jgi:phosphoadenosine phosphosulfate reductase